MASISFPPLIAPTVTPTAPVQPVAAALPAAALMAEADALLPFSLPLAARSPAPPAASGAHDPAALRPDQIMMARHLHFAQASGPALASSWHAMVTTYAAQLRNREQQARAGQWPAALLSAAQDGRARVNLDAAGTVPPDAWRFTVHAHGPKEQRLAVITAEPDRQQGRRRRARAALRLELEMADGARVVLQAEALPGGVLLELCAADAQALERLRALQPAFEAAISRAGLTVLRWAYRATLPAGTSHARLPSADAATMLTLPVFRAVAELALLLPAPPRLKD